MARMRRYLTVMIAALFGVIIAGMPATADPWGGHSEDGGPPYWPDKSTHSWCYTSSVTATVKAYVPGALNYLYNSIDIPGIPQHPSCDTQNSNQDGDPATDVAFFEAWIGTGVVGTIKCRVRTASDSSVCDQHHLYIGSEVINATSMPHQQYIKTVCHELGHTVGLYHYAPIGGGVTTGAHDCMASGDVAILSQAAYIGNLGTWLHTYNAHHLGHINAEWP